MANTSTPFGLRPVRYLSGAPYNGAVTPYHFASGDATATFLGDPVKLAGTATTYLGEIRPDIVQGTAGAMAVGVLIAMHPETQAALVYRAASTARKGFVANDPDLLFEIEEGITGAGAGTALAANDIGLSANWVITAGSTVTGVSGTVMDNSTEATTVTLDLKIIGFVNRADNEIGSRAKWLVRMNNHAYVNQGVAVT